MIVTGRLFSIGDEQITLKAAEMMILSHEVSSSYTWLTLDEDWQHADEEHFVQPQDYVLGLVERLYIPFSTPEVRAEVTLFDSSHGAYILQRLMEVCDMAMVPVLRPHEWDDEGRIVDLQLLHLEVARLDQAKYASALREYKIF